MMTKLKYPALVLLAIPVFIFVKGLLSDKASEPAEHEYIADTLGNLQVVPEQPAEELPPPVYPVTPDSVFVWNELSYDFTAVRAFDPVKDAPTPNTLSASQDDNNDPIVLDWATLTNIEYRSEYFEEMQMDLYSPVFTEALKELNGKRVEITGYVIPVVDDGSEIALSQNPYAACFFCGKASPASVMSIHFDKPVRRLRTDDYRTFEGRMRLNYDDPNQFYYILEEAQLKRP